MVKVKVTTPGSSANLGPGFDCLACALGLYLRVEASPGTGLCEFAGEGAADLRPDNLIIRSARAVNPRLPNLDLHVFNEIPMGRGFGSSGAAVAAGIKLGLAYLDEEPDDYLAVGESIEGHRDNLVASFWGGLAVVTRERALVLTPNPDVVPVLFVPEKVLKTSEAREVLPSKVDFQSASGNVGWACELVALLTMPAVPDLELLLDATQDKLHQDSRAALMPDTTKLISRLRDQGVAAVVSGAGPGVLCLTTDETQPGLDSIDGWTTLRPGWDLEGTRVVAEPD